MKSIKCPKCGKMVLDYNQRCPKCGSSLSGIQLPVKLETPKMQTPVMPTRAMQTPVIHNKEILKVPLQGSKAQLIVWIIIGFIWMSSFTGGPIGIFIIIAVLLFIFSKKSYRDRITSYINSQKKNK